MPNNVRTNYATPSPMVGQVTTTNNDAVPISISGGDWASVSFKCLVAGTATVKAQYSIESGPLDGILNWLPAPFAKRISTLSANPTTQAILATTLVLNDVWEVPLPGNCTAFRIACDGTGTATRVQLQGATPYVAGVAVGAVLYDTTSGTQVALDTLAMDVSGWSQITANWIPSGATATAVHLWTVDEAAGTTLMPSISQSITTPWAAYLGEGGAGASSSVGGSSQIPIGNPPARIRCDAAAVASQTTRIRISVRR